MTFSYVCVTKFRYGFSFVSLVLRAFFDPKSCPGRWASQLHANQHPTL